MVTALGLLILLAGGILYTDVAGNFLIRNLTSRSLGTLAPGYAASRSGIRVYSNVIASFGILVIGLGATDWAGTTGAFLAVVGLVMFVVFSALAIAGEVRTYRALKR
ncbi:MAG TPA: hypothetical protein VGJ79_05775 [Candidatus Dormibacteraeota bacterium]|jgi:hypothetical protein